MKQWTAFGASSALALLLGTTAVQAEVSAEQVWQGWVDYYTASGQVVTSDSSTMEGDTLVVKNAAIASKPNEAGTFKISLSEVRLRETGDGRVEITLQDAIPAAPFARSRELGSLILVDPASNSTAAAVLVE